MNEDEMQAVEPFAGEDLERQLARYARLRLDPTPAQARRARAAVMEAAWRRRLDPAAVGRPHARRRGLFSAWSGRRVALSLTAAILLGLLTGSTAFAATRAGGLLYEARLAFETLTLPSDPAARFEAQLAGAQARLAELVEAAGRGDEGAIAASLAAYERSLDELGETSGAPASRALEAVQFHRAVLLRLVATVPNQAVAGLENALDRSSGVIERLGTAGAGTSSGGAGAGEGGSGAGTGEPGNGTPGNGAGGPGYGGGGSGAGAGAGGDDPGGPGAGGPGGKPDKTPAAKSPDPDPTPKPTKSPKPDGGRAAAPSPTPGNDDQGHQ